MAATLSPCVPPEGAAGERTLRLVRTWGVGDAAGIGRVRHDVVDCLSSAAPGPRGHLGLVGMRERVALFGGSLRTGPALEGGFAVHAVLPRPGGTL